MNTDDVSVLAKRFDLISGKSVKKGQLDETWRKTSVLSPRNLLEALLSEDSVRVLRRELKKNSVVHLSLEDTVSGIRRLLNEAALTELENARFSLLERKPQKRQRKAKKAPETPATSKASDTGSEEEKIK